MSAVSQPQTLPPIPKRHLGPARVAVKPRFGVRGKSSLKARGQTLLRIRPTLHEEVKALCPGPFYLVVEYALERLLHDLRQLPENAPTFWLEAEDLEPTLHDVQMLEEQGRTPKSRSEYGDSSRQRKKSSS